MIKIEEKEFLFKYISANAPTGYETAGQKIWLNYIKPYINESFIDTYGTTVGIINPGKDYKVVIEAHADEISWFINYISDDGYIYVIRNGGSDFEIAPSMKAKIHTEKGPIPAVFGWPAIHVRDSSKKVIPNIENVILDCGCNSRKEIEKLGIHVGTVVTFDQDYVELQHGFLAGRAFDNRIGGYMIAQVVKRIKENKINLPYSLYIVNAVQEEVGLRGAQMITNEIKPDLAIITDVTHDTQSPLYNKKKQGDIACKKGPVLTYAPSVQSNVLKMLIDIATKKKIPFQRAASSRSTGTDTDAFAYSNSGVASALISLPLKYMHTTVETVHQDDIENVIKLMYEFLVELTPSHSFKNL